ncbi:MAG: hypothetical protein E7471_05255 [Ruminococcaceae bacterium]|nr:hypothetical protein [Oscillospiraceae bacterium]
MEKVTQYLDQVFFSLPQTEQVLEYRDTLQKQLEVVFRAECAAGKTEDEAMETVVASAPVYEAICRELDIFERERNCDAKWYDREVRRLHFWTAIAIGLFVLSPFAIIAFAVWRWTFNLPAGLAFLCFAIGIGAGILIYVRRERARLKGMNPQGAFSPIHARYLVFGIILCIFSVFALGVSLSFWEGKARYWECASCLIYAAAGISMIVYFGLCRKWLKR